MNKAKTIYILISIFCIVAIASGIYAQFFISDVDKNNIIMPGLNQGNEKREKTQEEIKTQFSSLFTNSFTQGDYDITNIQKVNEEKDLIYSAYDIQNKKENYEVDIHLPVINIKADVPASFNNITQTVFANKASQILNSTDTTKTIYNITYAAYLNGDILSLIIKSTLKEGNNPQRIIVQTYNYNLATGKKVEASELLSQKNIIQSEAQNKINQTVKKAQENEQILVQSGYPVYNRDLSSEKYKIANLSTYFLGPNGELYIVFAYGNNNHTSAIDIVLYE